jgi:hypothetical protein
LSAYEIVFRPVVGPNSLRFHGATTTSVVGGQGAIGATAPMTVGRTPTAPVPIGAEPPVTVIRSHEGETRACSVAISASTAARTASSSSAMPSGSSERRRRVRCRVSANGRPSTTLIASNAPSPTNAWSSARRTGSSGAMMRPSTYITIGITIGPATVGAVAVVGAVSVNSSAIRGY